MCIHLTRACISVRIWYNYCVIVTCLVLGYCILVAICRIQFLFLGHRSSLSRCLLVSRHHMTPVTLLFPIARDHMISLFFLLPFLRGIVLIIITGVILI